MAPESPFQVDEPRRAWGLTGLVLLGLTVAKFIAPVPYFGPMVLSGAAFMQLYIPMWRCEAADVPYAAVGLSLHRWRDDLRNALWLAAWVFPAYALGVHIYLTDVYGWLHDLSVGWLGSGWEQFVPRARWQGPALGGALGLWHGAQTALTHLLGVALPEETFYRGYLQPQLERRWAPRWRWFGVAVGRGAIIAAALFALGHFLGEWNVGRFGPFFPALLFAWLRNRTQTVMGAVLFHALCNIFSEAWFGCYVSLAS